MRKKAKGLALLMAGAVIIPSFGGTGAQVYAADETWVSDEALTDNNTEAPESDIVVPNKNQFDYQKEELAAFVHFGPNTFNNIEWGENYGDRAPDDIFTLEKDFDENTLVKALHDAGFKKVIVTAKHHDGFCIWDSEFTEYDVAATSYQNAEGQKDILAEISAACTEYGLEMGLYLSPWDIHDESYGYYDADGNSLLKANGQPLDGLTWDDVEERDVLDYNDYYNNQLEEILGNPKYGNNGHFVEVWMDGAKGSGASAQNYDFERWFNTIQKHEGVEAGYPADCMLFGAEAYTTVRWIGNEDGIAGKNTWSKSTVNYENNTINSNQITENGKRVTVGFEEGNQWTVPEADARITSGWFWGNSKKTPKTIEALGNMYFNSVGHNSPLLLNIPPNDQGTVDEEILKRVEEFGQNIEDTFRTNMAADTGSSVQASNVRGSDLTYGPGTTVDGNDLTYWTTEDGTNRGSLLIDLGRTRLFDVVSIEEAIQHGQRINEYTVEYRNGDSESWQTLDTGETIGAKRLIRTGAVRASQIKITVATSEGKVPMISEIGVYKASEGFELSGGVPVDLELIDNTDKATADGSYFSYPDGTWTQQTGLEYINNTNMWANPGAEFTVHFTGTQIYLLGTRDPNHGTALIYIDDELVETIDTNAGTRSLGQVIFASDTLSDSAHTLRLVVENKAIGVEAAAVLNNGGAGMFEIEQSSYTMNEESNMQITVNRVGGSTGEVSVLVSNEPGSAVQGDMDPDQQTRLTFAEGETTKTATISTQRNTNITGDLYFTVTLTDPTGGAVLGFNDNARVTIIDTESSTAEGLNSLIEDAESRKPDWYVSGWQAVVSALADGKAVAGDENATLEQITQATANLRTALESLTARERYTEEDPFVFPWRNGSSAVLEAEFASVLEDDPSNNGRGPWPLSVSSGEWASNGKYINALNNGDVIKYHYTAEKAGTYNVTVYYRSGSNSNALSWSSEPEGNITANTQSAGAANTSSTHSRTFTMEVNQTGPGMLVFTAPSGNSPQIDYFEITPADISLAEYTVSASAGEGGAISNPGDTILSEGDNITYEITPEDGYEIADVKVNGVSVGVQTSYTISDISDNVTIEATFSLKNYTQANRFPYPTGTEAVTLEAEHFILNNTGAADERWKLQVTEGTWASGGKFVNSLNTGDTISLPFTAQAGIYEVTVTYRSGSNNNSLSWNSDPEGMITAGTAQAGHDDASQTRTSTFNVTVTETGNGMWIFTGPSGNSPQLDKFEIRVVEQTGPTVDKSALEQLIREAEVLAGMTDTHTPESLEALQTAIAAAQSVFEDPGATETQVTEQITALQTAIDSLKPIETPTDTFTITVTANAGGTVNPSGTVSVQSGGSQMITITPDPGYTVSDVLVNGASIGAVTEYLFENVTSNCTIAVTFTEETVTPTPEPTDKTQLGITLVEANTVLTQSGRYTQQSLAAYQAAVDAAAAVYANPGATQAEIDAATQSVLAARNLLVPTAGTPQTGAGNAGQSGTTSGVKTSSAGSAVPTGDPSGIMIWVSVLAAAFGAAGSVLIIRKNKNKAGD